MEFVSGDASGLDGGRTLRVLREGGRPVEAWLSEGREPVKEDMDGRISFRRAAEGVFGEIESPVELDVPGDLERAARDLYGEILTFAQSRSVHLVRVWNSVPRIAEVADSGGSPAPRYHEFNAGRFKAFAAKYGGLPRDWPVPAASTVGGSDGKLRVEFFATDSPPVLLENKSQVPSRDYSGRHGAFPPLFARGAICSLGGQRLLISAGTGSVVGEESRHAGDLHAQVLQSIQNLRILASQFNLKLHGIQFGFGLEDLVLLGVHCRDASDLPYVERLLRSALDPDCQLVSCHAQACRDELLVQLEGVFLKKGEYLEEARKKYRLESGRIRVESLEVHVTEHCNLKCRGCDAMSPYNDTFFLPVDEASRVIAFMARHVVADVFKLMGGEPTLHPCLLEILRTVKTSGITRVLRLTTNGLLLHLMPDEFWELLDRLTVSNYSSGSMKAETVALVERKAREHGVLLNLKWIDQFSRVFLTSPIEDAQVVRENYADCWIRHRSLVVRKGCFFKCTRAAYMDDFRAKLSLPALQGDEASYTAVDGVPLAADGFRERLLDYLNSPEPLASCRYCLGASGELLPHRQLTREEIRRGVV